jgi:FtsH-binding integral membrane protein
MAARTGAVVDAGLRAHMQRVYNRMTLGLVITAITAYVASHSFLMTFIANPMVALPLALAPLAIIWFGFRPDRMSSNKLRATFVLLSVLYGLSFATIFLVYVPADIVRALLMTTIMFAGLSIYGYVTKRDLGPVGVFCFMGMLGLLAFSVLYMLGAAFNVVEASPLISNIISIATIVIFAGLTAYETQATKEMYNPAYGEEGNSRLAWSAALNLYISFIAIFQSILQLLSNRE